MVKTLRDNRTKKILMGVIIAVLGVFMAVLEWIKIPFSEDVWYNGLVNKILQQTCGIVAAIFFLRFLDIKLFGKVQKWVYLIPCIIVAVNNFQWWSYFKGLQTLTRTKALDIILFAVYCLCVGMFEEFVFRGVLFSVLAGYFPKNKKGFIETFVISSLIFGAAHIFNFDFLQVGYTILTGGLFAFVLIKTKNLLCCGFIHGLYNFCGLLMEKEKLLGLGSGVVLFNLGTVLCMAIVGVLMAAFVLYCVFTYPEEERKLLYERLGVKEKLEKAQESTEEPTSTTENE